jgi:hypothetical protein
MADPRTIGKWVEVVVGRAEKLAIWEPGKLAAYGGRRGRCRHSQFLPSTDSHLVLTRFNLLTPARVKK